MASAPRVAIGNLRRWDYGSFPSRPVCGKGHLLAQASAATFDFTQIRKPSGPGGPACNGVLVQSRSAAEVPANHNDSRDAGLFGGAIKTVEE
jgi:hypothetical protein